MSAFATDFADSVKTARHVLSDRVEQGGTEPAAAAPVSSALPI